MRTYIGLLIFGGLLIAASPSQAQGPSANDLMTRMLAFDKDSDGKLTRAEITDERLIRLFDRADTDKDGVVTKAELTALATKEQAKDRADFGGGPGGFGGGPGGPGGGPPGFGGSGGMPKPGDVLSPMFQQRLKLTDEQKAELDTLQKDVDARLAKILSSEQKATLKEMRDRGPSGFGGPPGGRRGGPGGPPPGGPGGPPPGGPGGPPPDSGPPQN